MERGQTYIGVRQVLWVGLCMLLLCGCSRGTYVGELPEDDDAPLTENIPIVLGFGVSSFDILTRGSGAVESGTNLEFWKNAKFYVYAFNKNVETDLSVRWSEANEDICLLDANRLSEDGGQSSSHGKEVRVKVDNSNLMPFFPDDKTGSQDIYYNMKHTDWPYNFFAYYLDDLDLTQLQCVREKNRIYYDVELDGRRDFMSSVANPKLQEDKYANNPYKQKIMDRAYSAYSASHGLNPVFSFQHHLVRLRFVICRPEEGGSVPSINESLVVKKVSVKSKVRGRFTVAVNDIDADDAGKTHVGLSFNREDYASEEAYANSEDYLYLLKKNGEEIGSDGWCRVIDCKKYSELSAEDKKKPSFLGKEDENDNSGASLLLAPATTYSARIFLDEDKSSDPGHGFVDVDLEPGGGAGFVAGGAYVIYLTINSLSDIKPNVEIGEWTPGGETILDPDGEFEDK
ncbi:hypothetical protein F2Z20_05090 [Bacteroides finegoldii]|uniref:Fimbrillin family protein n=2 Tax=Bacteroides finegoldii TaxID=338188 RepID=A0A7J4YQ15_9BACE|nr:hypothetical protein F2Z28_05765 [Bacteroides finegoldii]KAA5222160.1 hypothetical protein F2Z16_06540 [Bacteroides finegoldii]KAA5227377.1 hypothetical protein F2Z20_05090 [Bacteroides finegoldii]KAA5230757.1 hypothetical protein F2Z22_08505 [Bacteroides finegoldii]KAA5236098.1 hypothetical protein F2Z17_03985 [Bacteroides finegoldii]